MLRSLPLLLPIWLLASGLVPPAAVGDMPVMPHVGLEVRCHPLESQLLKDASEGRFDEGNLLRAGLIASGVEDEGLLDDWSRQFDNWVAELSAAGVESLAPRHRAASVLQFLHARVLRGGYQSDCSDLVETLRSGRFNCVTAVVLFNALAARVGLPAEAIELPGHMMSRIETPAGPLEIETTWPEGATPDGQRDLVTSRRVAAATVPLAITAETQPRPLSPAASIAILYYNRGIDCLERSEFAEAVSANCKALWLDPASRQAADNLLAALNNWALDLHGRGESAAALARLELGQRVAPDYAPFAENRRAILRQAIDRLAHAERYEDALDLLDAHDAQRPAEELLATLRFDTYCRWHRVVLQRATLDEALAHFERARQRYPDAAERIDAERTAWQVRGLALLEREAHAEATEVLAAARVRFPEDAEIDQSFRAAAMRWAEEAFRQGDYAAAIRRSTFAAQPGRLHPDLVNNVRYAYYRWAGDSFADDQWDEAIHAAVAADEDPFLAAAGHGDLLVSLLQRQFADLAAAGDDVRIAELWDRLARLPELNQRNGLWQRLSSTVESQLVQTVSPVNRNDGNFYPVGTSIDDGTAAEGRPVRPVRP